MSNPILAAMFSGEPEAPTATTEQPSPAQDPSTAGVTTPAQQEPLTSLNDILSGMFGRDVASETSAAPEAPVEKPVETPPVQQQQPTSAEQTAAADDPLSKFPEPEKLVNETPEARAKWGELRRELHQRTEELKRIQSQQAPPAEEVIKGYELRLAESQKAIEDYEQRMMLHKLEDTMAYRQTVTEPLSSIVTAVEELAKANNISEDLLIDAITETDRNRVREKLTAAAADLSEMDRLDLYQYARQAQEIYRRAEEFRQKAAQALQEAERLEQEMSAKETARRLQEQRQKVEATFDGLLVKLPPEIGELEPLREQALQAAASLTDPDAAAYAVSAGFVLPKVVAAYRKAASEVAQLRKTLETIQRAKPTASPTGGYEAGPQRATDNPVVAAMFGRSA